MLSTIINSGDAELFLTANERITVDDLSVPFHAKIFEFLASSVLNNALKIDRTLLVSLAKKETDKKRLEELIAVQVPVENFSFYLKEVKNAARLRRLKSSLNKAQITLANEGTDAVELIGRIEDEFLSIVSTNSTEFSTPKNLLVEVMESIRQGEDLNDLTTSLPKLDRIAGLKGYVVLAARPSLGKTELMLQICVANALMGKRCAIFSLEMDELELTKRIISSVSGIEFSRISRGNLSSMEMVELERAMRLIEAMPLHINSSGTISATQIAAKAKRLKIKHPDLALVAIDYAQLIACNDKDDQNAALTKTSRTLKGVSASLRIPVLLLSQLSRGVESREDKRPRLSDLRGSGSLEQDADIVEFLYSDGYYDRNKLNAVTEVIVAKNRNGPLGTVLTKNVKEIQRFVELED